LPYPVCSSALLGFTIAIKMYVLVEVQLHLSDLGTRCKLVFIFTPRPLYPQGRILSPIGYEAERTSKPVWILLLVLVLAGNETWTIRHAGCRYGLHISAVGQTHPTTFHLLIVSNSPLGICCCSRPCHISVYRFVQARNVSVY
jgi:hypothetical protein